MHLQESQFKEKNHMVTEKSNSTQLQVIFESLDQQSFPSNLYCGVLQINGFVIYGGLTRKNQRESKTLKVNVEIFTQFDVKIVYIWTLMSKLFRFSSIFQQIRVLSE